MFSLSLLAILASFGCTAREANEVVIYCALDREFAEPVLTDYEKETGLQALAKYDVESTKTVGLANAIIAEKNRPRCDLFWNNEILHTLRLKRLGLLESFSIPQASQLPSDFRDPDQQWYGFAARARVLLVNTDLVPESERPDSVDDLIDPKWAGKVGIAKPLFGTTATHAAVLFASRGEDQAMEFFQAFKKNGKVLGGNKQVAQAVASGEIAFGLTDTDDAIIEVEAGRPVTIVFPDQSDNQPGTLLVPNTLCLIKGGPHQAAAHRLAAKIVSRATEERLAQAASAQIPLIEEGTARPRILPAQPLRWMRVDFQDAADQWERVNRRLAKLFSQA